MTKQLITEHEVYPPWAGLSLPQLLKRVEEALEEYGPLSDFNLRSGYDGDDPEVRIRVRRYETQEEEQLRIERDMVRIARQDAYELEQYKRLKQKFEKND